MKQGFIFTLDMLFAMLMALTMFTAIILFMSPSSTPDFSQTDLHHQALSLLQSIDSNYTLHLALKQDKSHFIKEFLENATSARLCANLSILNQTLKVEQSFNKTNCPRGNQIAVARQPLHYSGITRMAVMETWYK
ncbi:MAG: hypothetical protein AABX51_04535 [Nanoarchaeota archaeon]